jgi:lipopolysaccharide transport system permease protein
MSGRETIIRPSTGWLRFDLDLLWRYRDLLWSLVFRDIAVRYRQTVLGPIWLVAQPLAMTGVLTTVASGMAGISTNGERPELFYMAGMVAWTYFSSVVYAVAQVFTVNEYLFSKVYFPRIFMPMSTATSYGFGVLIQLVPLLLMTLVFTLSGSAHPTLASLLTLPLALIQLVMIALGAGLLIASTTAKYRDLVNAAPFGVQLWLFVTPVVYSLSVVPAEFRPLMAFINPLAINVELWRYGVLGSMAASPLDLLLSVISSTLLFVLGAIVFQRVERTAADTI